MKRNTNYVVSSSDEEEQQKPKSNQQNASFLQTSEVFRDILSKNKVTKFDFNKLETSDTLFDQDITEDDEIWLVQCPRAEMNLNLMKTTTLDFDSSVSKLKCKVNKKRKRYNVYAIPSSSSIGFALPSKETKSFRLKSFPLAGKIVLQEDVRVGRNTDNLESTRSEDATNNSTVVDFEVSDISFNPEEITEIKPEEFEESFRRKKKKKRSSAFNSMSEM